MKKGRIFAIVVLSLVSVIALSACRCYAQEVAAAEPKNQLTLTVDLTKVEGSVAKYLLQNADKVSNNASAPTGAMPPLVAVAAESTTETANDLLKGAIATAKEVAADVKDTKPEEAAGWIKTIGDAFAHVLSTLGLQANALITSKAGVLLALVLLLKVGGGAMVTSWMAMAAGIVGSCLITFTVYKTINKYTEAAKRTRTISDGGAEKKETVTVETDPSFSEEGVLAASLVAGLIGLVAFVVLWIAVANIG